MNEPGTEQIPDGATNPTAAPTIDPVKQEMLLQSLREQHEPGRSILFGFLTALACASLWALITELTDRQIGWMAIGVGAGVAYVVRTVGKGIDRAFGYWSAGLSLFGCVLGNVLTIAVEVAKHQSVSVPSVLLILLSRPSILAAVMKQTFNPIDLLFYGLAVYYGYRMAFRRLTQQELQSMQLNGVQ